MKSPPFGSSRKYVLSSQESLRREEKSYREQDSSALGGFKEKKRDKITKKRDKITSALPRRGHYEDMKSLGFENMKSLGFKEKKRDKITKKRDKITTKRSRIANRIVLLLWV